MLKKCVLVTAIAALLLVPAAARADWLFNPNIGSTFGGAADGREGLTYGASIGWMGAGVVGWEADLQYTPNFFLVRDANLDPVGEANVIAFMGNLILGVPVGGQTGPGIRPFGLIGMGVLSRRQEDVGQTFDVNSNEFGFNIGAGVMGFFSDHVGLRGDVHYVRAFEDLDDGGAGVNLGVSDFDFWRANIGVTFRW